MYRMRSGDWKLIGLGAVLGMALAGFLPASVNPVSWVKSVLAKAGI